MSITRREFCEKSAAFAVTAAVIGTVWPRLANAQATQAPPAPNVSAADLMTPSPLGDMVLGQANAPVTIVEYASMTCPHCAHFAANTMPKLKKDYIDTGKVRYILREFPLDPLAAAGFMLARCASNGDKDKYYAMIDTLFAQQNTWVVQKPLEPLKAISKQAGLSSEDFDKCLANQSMLDGIEKVRQHAIDKLGVKSTPTFFINGQQHAGDISMDELAKLMQPYLKAG